MTRGVPVLDPKVRLVGATPVSLARALFRNKNPELRPGAGRKPVVGNQGPVEEPTAYAKRIARYASRRCACSC